MEHAFSTARRRSGALAGSLAAIGLLVSSLPGTSTAAELDAAAAATTGREVVGFFRFGDWMYLIAAQWDPTFNVGSLDFHRLMRAKLIDGKLAVEDVTRPVEGEREWARVGPMKVVGEKLLVVQFDKRKLIEIGGVTASQDIPDELRAFGPDGSVGPPPDGVRYEHRHGILAPEGVTLRPARWETGDRTENERYRISWTPYGPVWTRTKYLCRWGHPEKDYHSVAYRRGGPKIRHFMFCSGLDVTDKATGRRTSFRRTRKLHKYLEEMLRGKKRPRVLTTLPSNRVSAAWLSGYKVWVGTFDAGLCRIDLATEEVTRPPGSRSIPKDVSTLFERGGKLYVGTFRRGLYVLDLARGRAARVTGVPGERIARLVPFGEELWIGTDVGVAVLEIAAGAEAAEELSGVAEARAVTAAAGSGDAGRLEALLAKAPATVNALDDKGRSALIIGADAGHAEAVKVLLEAGADAAARDRRRGWTALHFAANNGRAKVVEALLSRGAGPDARRELVPGEVFPPGPERRTTALHLAAAGGHDEVVRLLISRGAEVNVRGEQGWTPLHGAARAGRASTVRILLEADAAVNDRCGQKKGMTPLHVAAAAGRAGVIDALLAGRADIEAKVYNGTALHLAASEGHLDAVRTLLDRGADVNAGTDSSKITPLRRAASGGHPAVVRLLIARGADTEAKGDGRTGPLVSAARGSRDEVMELFALPSAIHEAAKAGELKKVKSLVEADPALAGARAATVWGEKQDERWTPLHFAAKYGHAEVVEFLLSKKVDPNPRVRTGLNRKVNSFTPLWFAVFGKHRKAARILLEHGADPNARTGLNEGSHAYDGGETLLFWTLDDTETVKLLLDHGADPNAHRGTERRSVTPLHWAASAKRKEMVELLLSGGAKPLEQSYTGDLAVRWAARQKDNMDIVKLLLDHMGDIDVKDRYHGETHLMWAARERDVPLEFAELLVARGADLGAPSRHAATPLHTAAVYRHVDMARFLVSKGADVNARDRNGRTPLGCAIRNNAHELADLLRRAGGVE